MARARWHETVIQALEEVGKQWKYEILNTRVIHIHLEREPSKYQFEYHPDACWLYRGKSREEPNAIFWEIESGDPDYKRVCGDVILGGLVTSRNADCYPWGGEIPFGFELQEDVAYPLFGKTKRKRVYRQKERILIHPNVKAIFIIVQDYDDDYSRYVETIRKITNIVPDAKVFSIKKRLYKSQMKNRLQRLCWLREKYK